MSAPFFLPFNFQPASSTVKTGDFTIPSGKYGLIVNLGIPVTGTAYAPGTNNSGTKSVTEAECFLHLNGSPLFSMPYTITSTVNISSNATSRTATVTMPLSYGLAEVAMSQSASTGGSPSGGVLIAVNGVSYTSGSLNGALVGSGNSSINSYQNSTSSTYSSTVISLFSPLINVFREAWVKGGDIITAPSDAKYLFVEYNEIT